MKSSSFTTDTHNQKNIPLPSLIPNNNNNNKKKENEHINNQQSSSSSLPLNINLKYPDSSMEIRSKSLNKDSYWSQPSEDVSIKKKKKNSLFLISSFIYIINPHTTHYYRHPLFPPQTHTGI